MDMTSLRDLLEAGLLQGGTKLVWKQRSLGRTNEAILLPDGKIQTSDGLTHKTPSGAAKHIIGRPVDGWVVWKIETSGDSLADIRKSFT
jgi:hypothetical protein